MIPILARIANKLGITHRQMMLLNALVNGWLNVLARRQAQLVVMKLIEKFQLDEHDWQHSYADQLLAKGVLTGTEAEVFGIGKLPDEQIQEEDPTGDDGGRLEDSSRDHIPAQARIQR